MLEDIKLTVLMTVYNGREFLRTCIDSMLCQTYSDFRFLIIDDASTDDSVDIINSYGDPRIDLVRLENNVGQTAALNVGLRQIKTTWVARMDADDYCPPTRFEEQMQALAEDSTISCLGTWAWIFYDNPDEHQGEVILPEDYEGICRHLLRSIPIVHGTIVAKTEALLDVGGYDERYRYAADMELYDRLLPKYYAVNLPRKLFGIRHHPGQGQRTPTSLNELIAILWGRLESDRYTPKDRVIIRSTLSRQLIVRARYEGGQGRIHQLLPSLIQAFRLSPKAFFLRTLIVFLGSAMPQHQRSQLKRTLVRVLFPTRA